MRTFYIVTPCFNAAQYLDETIMSVVTQSGNFYIRYHIQDGGSNDDTVEKLKLWEQSLANSKKLLQSKGVIFSWASEADLGMYDAINKGFSLLQVPDDGIMAWINADDTYFPHAFSTAAKAFDDLPDMRWFGAMVASIDSKGGFFQTPPLDYYPIELVRGNCCDGLHWWHIQQNGSFWKGELWQQAGPLDANLRYAGDCMLWPQFANYAEFLHLPTYIGTFRSRVGQLSSYKQYSQEIDSCVSRDKRRKIARNFFLRHPWPMRIPKVKLAESGKYVVVRTWDYSIFHSYYSLFRLLRLFLSSSCFEKLRKFKRRALHFASKVKNI